MSERIDVEVNESSDVEKVNDAFEGEMIDEVRFLLLRKSCVFGSSTRYVYRSPNRCCPGAG